MFHKLGTLADKCTWQDGIALPNYDLTNGLLDADCTNSFLTQQLRRKRTSLLKKSDWTQLPDSPLTGSKKTEWATYRQQLRDITNGWTPSETVDFPDEPT